MKQAEELREEIARLTAQLNQTRRTFKVAATLYIEACNIDEVEEFMAKVNRFIRAEDAHDLGWCSEEV